MSNPSARRYNWAVVRFLRWLFCGIAAVGAVFLILRAVVGPFWIVHNPLPAETALATSVICTLLIAGGPDRALNAPAKARWMPAVLVFLAAAIAVFPTLSMPLITDDYRHIAQIVNGDAPTPVGCLTHACGGPQVFRPLGFSTYWAEWELWGMSPMPRHVFDLVLHAIASVLFLLVVQRLGVSPPFDWLAGLLFAFNGIRAEAVAWPGARFDTLVLLFSFAAALFVLRGGRLGLIGAVASTIAACLSKESAYVLPVLLALLLGRAALTRAGRILIGPAAAAGTVFAWRWIVLKGIGGYLQPDSALPAVLQFNAITFTKTFFARIWAVLWFPINWSRPLEWWMLLGLGAGLVSSCLLLRSRPQRNRVILCMAAVAVSCLPTHQMLLIGPSLEQSRYLNLAAPAFLCLLVFACMALPRFVGITALALMGAFQLAALEHNIRIWSAVSKARYELCRRLAERALKTDEQIAIGNVPLTVDGVYWRNGIEDCLWLDFHIPMGKVRVTGTQ